MPEKKGVTRRTRSKSKRKKRVQRIESEKAHNRTLIAILTLLFFLHLIDDKTFARITSTLSPSKKRRHAKGKRRKRKVSHPHSWSKRTYPDLTYTKPFDRENRWVVAHADVEAARGHRATAMNAEWVTVVNANSPTYTNHNRWILLIRSRPIWSTRIRRNLPWQLNQL